MDNREEVVKIESLRGGGPSLSIDRNTTYEVVTDLTMPSEARFELGDNSSWNGLEDAIAIGRRFSVKLNNRALVTGRLLTRRMPLSAQTGATVQLTVRTHTADAAFQSCDPVNIKNATLKDIVLKAYASIGVTESDFQFDADVERSLLTGRGKNTGAKVQLEKLSEQDARVQPPETVRAFVDRHLRRFGLMHWDGPGGKIVVGKPNDAQAAIYRLQCLRSEPRGNNVLSAMRTQDYEQVPGELYVYGRGGGRNYMRTKVKSSVTDPVLLAADPVLRRKTIIIDDAISSQALAESRAKREMAQRALNKDSWDLTVVGWCHRLRGALIPYAIDTVGDVLVDTVSPVAAPYYIWRVALSGSVQTGHMARLTAAAKGVWVI